MNRWLKGLMWLVIVAVGLVVLAIAAYYVTFRYLIDYPY